MEDGKINRNFIAALIAVVLIISISFVLFRAIKNEKTNNSSLDVQIKQLYSSDYSLKYMDEKYFIGSYEKNMLGVIIDNTGKEVYKGTQDILYDNIYLMKDGRYLIYSNQNNKLVTYVFDGEKVEFFYDIDNVSYVNPIIYKGIEEEYIIGFSSLVNNDLYLYSLTNGGIVVVNDVSLVADYTLNGTYYTYNENYLVIKDLKGFKGVIDLDGKEIIECKYKDIINTYNNSFIALDKKDKYGIINKNKEIKVKFNYQVIDDYDNYYIFVNDKNKMALYDLDYKKITDYDMNYNSLVKFDLRSNYNSINLYKMNGKVIIVNNYLEDKNGTEYDKHNLYIINNGKIEKNIKQIGFDNKDVIYTYDKEYNVIIYNDFFEEISKIKLNDIKKIESIRYVRKDVVMVKYISLDDKENIVYFNLNGNIVEFDLGNVVINKQDYYGYTKKNDDVSKLSIYDLNNNLLDDITGESIKVYGDYLIVDKGIYKIEVKRTNT